MTEGKTYLQKRIEFFVKTGKRASPNSHFIEIPNYRDSPFLDQDDFRKKYVTEDEVKTSDSYKGIKPAIQSRLAQMEFEKELLTYFNLKGGFKIFLGIVNLTAKQFRTNYLRSKAVDLAIKRKGGLQKMMLQDMVNNISLMDNDSLDRALLNNYDGGIRVRNLSSSEGMSDLSSQLKKHNKLYRD